VSIAFLLIVLFTIVNIFNIKPFVRWCTVKPVYEEKLFSALIAEIIILCLTVAGVAFDDRKSISKVRDEAVRTLELSLDAWEAASRSWLNEPSGLSHSGLQSQDSDEPILIGVDDEESAVFVLETRAGRFPLVRSLLVLETPDGESVADDLEAITYDGSQYYYAISSHRLLGEKKKAKRSRRLLQFEIPSKKWHDGYHKIVVNFASTWDLTSLPAGRQNLEEFLNEQGITVKDWKLASDSWPKYGLEIEGLAYYGGKLFIGLKWPLDSEKGLLVTYRVKDQIFEDVCRLDLRESDDQEPHGISALAVYGERLIVASNPPQKVDKESSPASAQYYGQSRLWAFSISEMSQDEPMCLNGLRGAYIALGPNDRDAKLEGIAVSGSSLYLAFEGDKPYFHRIELPQ
jgi:hypothetical protein